MMALVFKNAEEAKDAIMASQKQEIADLYEKWADEIGERAKYFSHKSTASSVVSERQMRELQKMLGVTGQEVSNEIYHKIKGNMYTIADVVVKDNIEWLKSFGFSESGLNAAFNYVPDEVVRNLITGQIYGSGWSLSSRIWGDNEQTMRDAYQIMAKGLAENKPVFEIAKELENYVRPSARKPWNPVLAMKNTKTGKIEYKRIYKKQVDYNAQRLARTLAQHSYQQSFLATTQKNPFITGYIWHSNGSRPCELCQSRDGVHYKKDELPMDHPNGMCTMEPVVANDMVDQLADWFNSPDGTYPEIDEFAGNFGYQASKGTTVQDFISKYGKSDKSLAAWHNSMTPIQKAEAKMLKEQAGQTWQQWYEQNIYTGVGSSKPAKTAKITFQYTKDEFYQKVYNAYNFSDSKSATIVEEFLTLNGIKPTDFAKYKDFFGDYDPGKLHTMIDSFYAKTAQSTAKSLGKLTKDNVDDYIALVNSGNSDAYTKLQKAFSKYGFDIDDFIDDYDKIDTNSIMFAEAKKKVFGSKAATNFTDDAAMFAKSSVGVDDLAVWDDMIVAQRDRGFLSKMRGLEDEWEASLTSFEKKAVHRYTMEGSNCYVQQNGYLRFGMDVSDEVKRTVARIHSAIEKSVTTEDMMLVRGTSTRLYTDIFKGNLKTALDTRNVAAMAGEVFQDPGFLSTSPNGDEFSGNLKFKIFAPAGTKGGYVEKNNYFGEREFLLQSNTTYYVEKAEIDSWGDIVMYLRVVV